MPQRIQRKRTKGWRMPEGAVYVGRPTKWGNPWSTGSDGLTSGPGMYFSADPEMTQAMIAAMYGDWLELGLDAPALMCGGPYPELVARRQRILDEVVQLRGHDLACWCPSNQPCHADVLLELANGGTS